MWSTKKSKFMHWYDFVPNLVLLIRFAQLLQYLDEICLSKMEFLRTVYREQQWEKVWQYLHYGLMRLLSDKNIPLSSGSTKRYLTIDGDIFLTITGDNF